MRVIEEINFLFVKEQNSNGKLYHIHKKLASDSNNAWILIENMLIDWLEKEMSNKYQNLDREPDGLTRMPNVDFNRVLW